MQHRIVLALGLTALLVASLAGCGSPGPIAMTSTTPSPAPTFTMPTRTFSSAALGVSFRYPATWPAVAPGVVMKDGSGTVTFRGPSGEVGAWVVFLPPAKDARPLPFGDADSSDLSTQRSSTGDKIIQSGLVTIDGLRLAEIESLVSGTRGVPAWYFLQFSSAGMGGDLNALHTSLLGLDVACPASQWPTQRVSLMAVFASMRFTRAKG